MATTPSPVPNAAPAPSTFDTVAADVATAAGVAAGLAPALGPYGLIAAQVLQGIEFLAKEAPDAFAAIQTALSNTSAPTPAQFAALRAQVAALSLDA